MKSEGMNKDELKSILEQHWLWVGGNGGKRANLQYADLQGANLSGANLPCANLRSANLQYADLQGANLSGANLRSANLQYANLQYADLQGANLSGANLQGANLSGANLDYSYLPLWCGSKGMIVDRRIAAQIAAHFCALVCDDADYQAARTAILEFASTSHRAMDLGLLEEIVKGCNDVATPIDVALRKRIAELEAERRWIPVSERMPEDLQSVVIITNDSMTGIVRYLELYGREGFGAWSEDVTHWMPLPEPPIVYGKVCEE
jgi:hypothetical protein